jgi:hypothetical protein
MSRGLLLRATQAQRFDEQNREAGLAIIEQPDVYQGAVLNWAKAFLARVDAEQEQRSLPLGTNRFPRCQLRRRGRERAGVAAFRPAASRGRAR